jgi:hypothetical protein
VAGVREPTRRFPRGPESPGNVFVPPGGRRALGRELIHRGGGLESPAEASRGGPSRQKTSLGPQGVQGLWAGANSPWRGSGGPGGGFPREPESPGNVFGLSRGPEAPGRELIHRGGGLGGPSRSFPRGPESPGNVFGPSGGFRALGRERIHRGGGLRSPAEAPRGGPSRQETSLGSQPIGGVHSGKL